MKLRLKILIANIINTLQNETAYFVNNIGNVFATIFYTIVAVLFINVLFSNVKVVAGYSKNEILFLLLVSQLSFYIFWVWIEDNRSLLIDDVKKGNLDFILVRPVPSLFFVSFRKINPIVLLRDGLPTLILVAYLINWDALKISLGAALAGIAIFMLGQIAWNGFCYLLIFPVFWLGESENIGQIAWTAGDTGYIPYEGISKFLKSFFTTIIPAFIKSAVCVSVVLGKSDKYTMLMIALLVAVVFSGLKRFVWKLALKNYTSAA